MGQAKQRGDFEQRKIQAVANDLEKQRLDDWLRARQPKPVNKIKRGTNAQLLGLVLASQCGLYPFRNYYQ